MNGRRFALLIGAAVLALVIAVAVQTLQKPKSAMGTGTPLLPQLRDHVNDVTAVTLTGAEGKPIVTMKRDNNSWTIAEKTGYPADVGKIRELLLKLDESKLIEPKTKNPERYAEIGVDDVKKKDAQGVRVDVAGLAQPASVIIGNSNSANGGGVFVRREGDEQSWLASPSITVAKAILDWEKRELVDIPGDRLKSVRFTSPDGVKAAIYKDDAAGDHDFKLADVPKGREPATPAVLTGIAQNLVKLRSEDVFPAKDTPMPDKTSKAEYTTLDGIVITVVGWPIEGSNYNQFSVKLDPAAADAYIAAEQAKAKTDYLASTASDPSDKSATGDKPATEDKSATADKSDANDKATSKPPSMAATTPKPLAVADPEKDRQERLAALNKEVETLNRTFNGWTFVLQPLRFANIRKTTDDLLQPVGQSAAAMNAPIVNPASIPADAASDIAARAAMKAMAKPPAK